MDTNLAQFQLNFSLYNQIMLPVENLIYFIQMTCVLFSVSLNKELKRAKEFSMKTSHSFYKYPSCDI